MPSKRAKVEVKSNRRNFEGGLNTAERGSSHTWGEDSETFKFRKATDNYYEVCEDVTRTEPTAAGFRRVTRTRVYFRDPTTGEYVRYETRVYYDARMEPVQVLGSHEGNVRLLTRVKNERDKADDQLDQDGGAMDDAIADAEGGGNETSGGAGDLGASAGDGAGAGGSAMTRGADTAGRILLERWGAAKRFERHIRGLVTRWYDGGRMADATLRAKAWADLPGKRAEAIAIHPKTPDPHWKAIHHYSPLEWDAAGRVEAGCKAVFESDEGDTKSFEFNFLLIPYLGEWGVWTATVVPEGEDLP